MEKSTLLVGFSKKKITPSRDVYLGGYIGEDSEENLCRYPQDVLGDVYVTTVCFSDGSEKALLICIDNCLNIVGETTPPDFLESIEKVSGVPSTSIFLTNTHNHQSIKYIQEQEVTIILESAKEASRDLRPVDAQWVQFHSDIGVNRRPKYIVSPHLPYDNTMSALCLSSEGRKDLIFLSYRIHNTAFGVGRMENAHYIFGELMGSAIDYLESNVDCVVFFANGFYGASGPNINGLHSADYQDIVLAGQQLGYDISRSLEQFSQTELCGLQVFNYEHRLPANKIYGADAYESLHIKVAKLGAFAFLAVDCEPFSVLGAWIKAFSPFEHTILLGNVNNSTGYIPTDEAFDAGSEERECRLNKTPYQKGIAEIFRTHCLNALYDAAGKSFTVPFSVQLTHTGNGCYEATIPEEMCNRIVFDFGFLSRDNCASDFVFRAGSIVHTFEANSNNFVSLSFEAQSITSIHLQVHNTYLNTRKADELSIIVHGIMIQ